MMSSGTNEQAAFEWMQARLIALLLRYDERQFRHIFAARPEYAVQPEGGTLGHYRQLAVLFYQRDDLFEHILPRIVRRLSFEAPRRPVIRELSEAYGQIDWERTLRGTWSERPGEPPLQAHARQRRRDFATPENLLTVVTLLEYQADVQRLLRAEQIASGSHTLRHPLNEIVERCERELVFSPFAGLLPSARQLLHEGETDALETQVYERLIPGGDSAYHELLAWRLRQRSLHLLRQQPATQDSSALGLDPEHASTLYQFWLFYELADLFSRQGSLLHLSTTPRQMGMVFRWQNHQAACTYELRYQQPIPEPVSAWGVSPPHAPHMSVAPVAPVAPHATVQPCFYLRRIDPPPQQVIAQGRCFWREPGMLWDTHYEQTGAPEQTRLHALKRLAADMALSGESQGMLLCALFDAPNDEPTAAPEQTDPLLMRFAPLPEQDQTVIPGQQVLVWRLQPTNPAYSEQTRRHLSALLADTHARLHAPRIPRCAGVFLDTLSVTEQQTYTDHYTDHYTDRYASPLESAPGELLLCPKPHIGPWRVDLVRRDRHCCQDARLCHIIGRPDARKPVRPPRTAAELLTELQHLFAEPTAEELDDTAVESIARQVEALTRRFAEIAGAYRQIELYYHRLRDLGMQHTLDLLGEPERESLALAVFLVEQLDSVDAQDYSAPVIHVSSVLEIELQRRVAQCPDLTGAAFPHGRPSLGTLPFMRRNPERTDGDWERLVKHTMMHWDGNVDPDAPDEEISFEAFVKTLNDIKFLRNRAAHSGTVSRKGYSNLFRVTCQAGPLRIGALNVLLLAWRL